MLIYSKAILIFQKYSLKFFFACYTLKMQHMLMYVKHVLKYFMKCEVIFYKRTHITYMQFYLLSNTCMVADSCDFFILLCS